MLSLIVNIGEVLLQKIVPGLSAVDSI
jgi:hypothetical protein